jgi:hypothetical protein
MWDLFGAKPTCPVDPEAQKWVDGRFQWLQDELGQETPRKVNVVLPTPEFFPDVYEGRPDDAQSMLLRVAGYMNVDPGRFKLFIFSDGDPATAQTLGLRETSHGAGLYVPADPEGDKASTRARIGLEHRQLGDPMALVATLAHEIGHEILLGQNRVSREQPDHEPLTDLLTVFQGMGIFTANSTIRDRGWSSGGWAGWQTSRLGYLDQRMFGYALARFAWTRGETNPKWIKHVRPDVRAPLKQGLRFLEDAQ